MKLPCPRHTTDAELTTLIVMGFVVGVIQQIIGILLDVSFMYFTEIVEDFLLVL